MGPEGGDGDQASVLKLLGDLGQLPSFLSASSSSRLKWGGRTKGRNNWALSFLPFGILGDFIIHLWCIRHVRELYSISCNDQSTRRGTAETNPIRNHEVAGSIPGLTQWVGDLALLRCGVSCRHSLDLTLLWLRSRPAAATLIRPLAWEPPCASGVTLKRPKKKKKKFLVMT